MADVGRTRLSAGEDALLERDDQLAVLRDSLWRVIGRSRGGLVLVPGEAGIGKTTLLRRFCAHPGARARVYTVVCDPLFTPRQLGPFLELADAMEAGRAAGGVLAGQLEAAVTPFDATSVLLREFRLSGPVVVVIEDVHWADQATLDAIRLLARRSGPLPLLLVLSYRDDDLERTHPLRLVAGELTAAGLVLARLSVPGLSVAAVAALADGTGLDPGSLHERTGGNPFFVTETIAARPEGIPASVRDAVLARAARLSPAARDLLDAAAVVPGPAEDWLLEALAPAGMGALDECVGAGMLTASQGRVRFRHEIARLAVEESLTPVQRVTLHRRALSVLDTEGNPAFRGRLAHHAEAAGDSGAVLRYAPAAARMAAAGGAHREAARLYHCALAVADRLPDEDRAGLLERYAEEGYFTKAGPEATAALRAALAIHRSRDDRLAQGRALRLLSMQLGLDGKLADSVAAALESVAILERIPPTAQLALSYSNVATATGVARDPNAREWGLKAVSQGERTGCLQAVYVGLNIVGSIEVTGGDLAGIEKLDRSREMAAAEHDYFWVGRAYLHSCWMLAARREWRLADQYLEAAVAFCREHGQEPWLARLRVIRSEALLACGRWSDAVAEAESLLGSPGAPPGELTVPTGRCGALTVLATVRARRGEPGCWPLLDEAADLAARPGIEYMQAAVAASRAEAAWLEGRFSDIGPETERPVAHALPLDPFAAHDLTCWRWRAAVTGDGCRAPGEAAVDASKLLDPYRMLLTGDWRGARDWWQERGQPYAAALTAVGSGDRDGLLDALRTLRRLGAAPAMSIVARELRGLGERGLPRPPRPATSAHPAGLTPREASVLALVAAGLSNPQIGDRLSVSPRTVEHHVSSILVKLGARGRTEAVATAVRLGLVQP